MHAPSLKTKGAKIFGKKIEEKLKSDKCSKNKKLTLVRTLFALFHLLPAGRVVYKKMVMTIGN